MKRINIISPILMELLEWALLQLEVAHSQIRRYEAPDETPFFPDQLKTPILPPINYPKILAKYSDEINVNSEIMKFYVDEIVPQVSCDKEIKRKIWVQHQLVILNVCRLFPEKFILVNLLLKQNIKVINHYISS